MNDIKLRKVNDPEPEQNMLPRGVHAVVIDDRLFFVRRIGGRFILLPKEEQEQLKKEHVI
jgi:hypothetical protein